jgi:serine/threonine protein phosphatase PrpC
LEASGLTDPGRVRLANQDAFAVLWPPQLPTGADALLIVADGMGGHRGGATASQLAIATITSSLAPPAAFAAGEELELGLLAAVGEAIRRASQVIYDAAAADQELAGMGTTCTLAVAAGDALIFGHVGDSRALIVTDGQPMQLTTDHSWVANEVREGRLTVDAAEHHPRKNLLLRAVGPQPLVDVDTFLYRPHPGDALVMCSDGLSGMLQPAEIAAIVTSQPNVEASCGALISGANDRGGIDNITAVVARVIEVQREAGGDDDADEDDEADTNEYSSL